MSNCVNAVAREFTRSKLRTAVSTSSVTMGTTGTE